MRPWPAAILLILAGWLYFLMGSGTAAAIIFGGGGSSSTDCLVVFDAAVNAPASNPRSIDCVDGDATCDADGTVNGRCEFPVAMCGNHTGDPRCTVSGIASITVDHAEDNGEPKFDPDFQALQQRIDNDIEPPSTDLDECTNAATITVPLIGPLTAPNGQVCRRNRKTVRVVTLSTPMSGRILRDTDRLRLVCQVAPAEPAPGGCDPQLFFTGTFDRIQRQIFNQSCAKSGCHDSQSQQQNLLLEEGASYSNLIDVTPTTPAAASLGWKRVTPGDPATSYLFHKITGDLGPDLGDRMPRTGRALDDELITIIELWIAAGAPDMGWVPGTF